ncbi:MAG TPA: phage holin family protein [Burkholderiales bacterium]|nr:phage holin family protein [Burkholderiales bacterium]
MEPHETSFLEPLERLFATLRRMATDYALLGILDVRRAAIQFAWLIGAGIFVTVLLVTAWLALVVALAVWMFGQGMSWPAVLSVAALLNLVGAGVVLWRVKHVFDQKPFSATLRQLKAQPPQHEKEP